MRNKYPSNQISNRSNKLHQEMQIKNNAVRNNPIVPLIKQLQSDQISSWIINNNKLTTDQETTDFPQPNLLKNDKYKATVHFHFSSIALWLQLDSNFFQLFKLRNKQDLVTKWSEKRNPLSYTNSPIQFLLKNYRKIGDGAKK